MQQKLTSKEKVTLTRRTQAKTTQTQQKIKNNKNAPKTNKILCQKTTTMHKSQQTPIETKQKLTKPKKLYNKNYIQ